MTNANYRLPEHERLLAQISRMQQDIVSLQQNRTWVPIVDSTPDPDSGNNIWAYQDGTLYIRFPDGNVRKYLPDTAMAPTPTPPPTTTPKPKPPPPPTTRRKVWDASWSSAYKANGDARTDTNRLYYGNGDAYNGQQRALIGFPSSVSTALTGARIKKVELYLHNIHSWWNNGVDIHFGIHNNTSEPTTYGGVVKNDIWTVHFGKPEAKWVTLPVATFGAYLRAGTGRGILIDQRSNDKSFYGYAAGVGDSSGNPPRLRITYVK